MKILINNERFTLILAPPHHIQGVPNLSSVSVVLDGAVYLVLDGAKRLQSVAHSQAKELTISGLRPTKRHEMPEEITILDRVWLRNGEGTYSRKVENPLAGPSKNKMKLVCMRKRHQ